MAPRKEVGAAGAGACAGRAGGGEERHRSPLPAHETAKRGPPSPPLDGESAAISVAREKGYWIRSDERRAAQGLESLYALAAQGPQGAKALFASCPVSLSHKSLYSKLIATLDQTTTNIDGTP